ncbi:MAG: riboflavin biosynthesis protein RibF [Lachnospiraceae bacterium]|nr:riboflavin biosynthesis protein RibF [Lachnospiraceae bacterium]
MQIISNTTDFSLKGPSAIAIGKFDGIHVGHQKLMEQILAEKKNGMRAVVFTFDPSPEELFSGKRLPVLDTTQEKRERFAKMGIDDLIEFPLNFQTASISPMDFMEKFLLMQLKAGLVVSGSDLSFGDKGKGNAGMLADFAKEHGFVYRMIDKVCVEGKEVSSSRVRDAVAAGNMEEAAKLLGTPYTVSGRIIHGNHIGHTLQMPTVNMIPPAFKLLPPRGVYATLSETPKGTYSGITNIGYKPTVSDEKVLGVETYLYDFDGNLYDEEIHTKLLHFMRPEQKFDGVEELMAQLQKDKEDGRKYSNQ